GIGVPTISRQSTAQQVRLMLIVVSVLLVISVASVTNMVLVRGAQKQPEAALRTALGASRLRLASYPLIEGLMLSLGGGLIGMGVARGFLHVVALNDAVGASAPAIPL